MLLFLYPLEKWYGNTLKENTGKIGENWRNLEAQILLKVK